MVSFLKKCAKSEKLSQNFKIALWYQEKPFLGKKNFLGLFPRVPILIAITLYFIYKAEK
jgi:hypothetical protein